MTVLSKLKQFLPASSRSFHGMYRELGVMHAEVHHMHQEVDRLAEGLDGLSRQMDDLANRLYGRVEVADRGINDNINYKFETRTIPKIEQLGNDLAAHDAHMKMFAWENYRREGETIQEAKERFFRSLPQATGGMRLLQLGCAKLLQEFDALCRANDISYWINFGTLLGAVRHGGFIPWDDDTDLGMMREDIERLQSIVADDPRYRITLVYDHYVHCRQIRFWYANEDVPCFLDLFIYDWVPEVDRAKSERQRELRCQMVAAMDADPELAFWKDEPYYAATGANAAKIQRYYDDCLAQIRDEGIVCSKNEATGIGWGVDNLDDGNQRQWSYAIADLLPTKSLNFEGVELQAPANPGKFLWSRYGDYYELPDDILSHFQHTDHDQLENPSIAELIKNLL